MQVSHVNYQNGGLNFVSSAEESVCGAASPELSGPLTVPLLGQLEHDASLCVCVLSKMGIPEEH